MLSAFVTKVFPFYTRRKIWLHCLKTDMRLSNVWHTSRLLKMLWLPPPCASRKGIKWLQLWQLFSVDEKRGSQYHFKVSKVAKIRNRYNQVPHLTQDTNGKVTNSQKTPQTRAKRSALSQQVTTKLYKQTRTKYSKHKTEQKHKRSTKEVPPWNGQ